MDEILQKLAEQKAKIDAIYKSVEKTRKYFLITLIASAAFIILPLIALLFVIPSFIKTITGSSLGL
ncbi:hypothetical protein COZ78_01765 [bacterium (Candidatus Gribaldobacteria) CG_4_8_14_3_um_filter_42_11]|uniref:Uncharacterized protein n=1 Tax=bacterium (Candidatus Gribaldobacteria) CG_4_8_14_3_um_filter_42_11 TaxID=2014267 RepID=A0A2M7IYB5_9BACT|nr:MAG: hypothetical protein AUJ36_01255 [Parcubacteria group bacterium CG1_02_41_26]PIX03183.1 MAG: hypothetical protein COZ78_01765 [bacterium (Candidatus Gribaldobacteria) CG_4_8_14_3_um_filter_42_11]